MEKALHFLSATGLLFFTIKAGSCLSYLWRHHLRSGLNLPDRYGPQSWVLITGAATGIGLAFAKAFAELQFNLILIDKDPSVTQTASGLQQRFQVQILTIVTDLTQTSMSELAEKWSDLDVSVLINNAGIHSFELFEATSRETIQSVINLNVVALTKLTHTLLPKLTARSNKSAIINMSSIAGLVPTPFSAIYSATKAYIRAFSLSLEAEINLDVLSVNPATVDTNMTNRIPRSYSLIDPNVLVARVLRALGYEKETMGAKRHIAQYELVKWRELEGQVSARYLRMQAFQAAQPRTSNSP